MFCSKCGKELRDDDIFCSGCGNKVAETKNVSETKSVVTDRSKEQNSSKEDKNIYVLIMGAIMMVLLFAPIYPVINRCAYDIEGWMSNQQKLIESVSLINLAQGIFSPEITSATGYFFVLFSFLVAIGTAIGLSICAILFMKDLYQNKVNLSYISANAVLSVFFAVSLILLSYSYEKMFTEIYKEMYYIVFEYNTTPMVWIVVAIALLNNFVVFELFSKSLKEEESR